MAEPKPEREKMPMFWVMGPEGQEVIYDFGGVSADQAGDAHTAATSMHGSTAFRAWSGSSKDRCFTREEAEGKYPHARVMRWNGSEWES